MAAGGLLPSGILNLGSIAGIASQAGALAGAPGAGLIGGATRAVQRAQTGVALLGKMPASIARRTLQRFGCGAELT